MKSEIKTQNISTKKLKFVAEIFLADLRYHEKSFSFKINKYICELAAII